MKKEIFAKIIELPTHQVLVTNEFNSGNDRYEVITKISLESCIASLVIGFKTKKSCDKYFTEFNEEIAKNILEHLISITPFNS